VFLALTGLNVPEFDDLVEDILPCYADAEIERLSRPDRRRALGGGRDPELTPCDQILLTVVWLRTYPAAWKCRAHEVLGFLFGVSDSTVSRYIGRVLPLLEAAGRDTIRIQGFGAHA
jgi:hypothetical protein